MKPSFLDPVMPSALYMGDTIEETINALREIFEYSGIRRFALAAPCHGVRVTGCTNLAKYTQIGQDLLRVKTALEPLGIEIGYNAMPTLKIGGHPFTKIKGIDGVESAISACPLDPDFQDFFLANMREVARIARPAMFWIEDDYQLVNHPGVKQPGCCCELHLQKFAAAAGRYYSREELMEIFATRTPEAFRLRKIFDKVMEESLVHLAGKISRTVLEVSPETRLALCEPCPRFAESIARALAGDKTPVIRYHGTSYGTDLPSDLSFLMFPSLYCQEHLGKDIEFFHESDPCPHLTFYASAVRMEALMTTTLFCGLDNCLFWGSPIFARGLETEPAYLNMFRKKHERLAAVRDLGRIGVLTGPEIIWREEHMLTLPWNAVRGADIAWQRVLGRYGFPYHTANGKLKLVKGDYALIGMSDDEIRQFLSGAVFMDGEAARHLTERGFSDLIGVNAVAPERIRFTSDLPWGEPDMKGFMSPSALHQNYGNDDCGFAELHPCGAEAVSMYCDEDKKPVFPSVTRFVNKLGGRIGVLALYLENNNSSNIFCPAKRELLRRTFEFLQDEDLPAAVFDRSNCHLTARRDDDGSLTLLITSASCDVWENITLIMERALTGKKVRILNNTTFEDADHSWDGRKLTVNTTFTVYSPVILKIG